MVAIPVLWQNIEGTPLRGMIELSHSDRCQGVSGDLGLSGKPQRSLDMREPALALSGCQKPLRQLHGVQRGALA